ncbi:MAG: tRNA (adenosine(37)-N6)-dimethylallyltransferase MiaA [Anaerolineae bacterium]|nr:MAG: tRNA (adenosine(37)-N6)-dimethylallyltransferase MiaA [Anaerolineae bacterium]
MKVPTPALVAILGPTAVGKTKVGIAVAEALEAEIVSADSRLIYRGMDIGTAKPDPEQLALIPHYLIDIAEPEESWSLVQFKRAADEAITQVQERERLPLLVGGTGQYVTAILEGWLPPPKAPDNSIRSKLEALAAEHGPRLLHAKLEEVDPATAEVIDPANVRRVARALEVYELTGTPLSEQRRADPPDYRILRLGLHLPRPELYARIDRRIDQMLERGLVDEVQALLNRGIELDHPPMSGIGYRQIGEYLLGERTLEEAVTEMRKLTRQFVRRQANWFKADDPDIEWNEVRVGLTSRLMDRIRSWLQGD